MPKANVLQAIDVVSMSPVLDGAGVLALLVDLETLAELVSVGTLFVFFCVSAGLIWRRYCRDGSTDAEQAQQVATRLGTIVACSFGACYSKPSDKLPAHIYHPLSSDIASHQYLFKK